MSHTTIRPHTITYIDAEGIQRETFDPTFLWYAERGSLRALATTQEGAVEMLDRMEANSHA